jgi:hypothetical protein
LTLRLAELLWPPRASVLLLLALGTASLSAGADDRLPQPKGPVVLSISGDIERTTDGTHALFDVSMLQALGLVTVRTRTPWTEGTAEFEGVLLRDVLRLVGAKRETILASALNDYVAEIPPADAMQHDVILALKKDGEYLTVRNMGPILVLYPFDSDPALQTEEVYARSVWQLSRLEVGAPAEDLPAIAAAEPAEPGEAAQPDEAAQPPVETLDDIAPASGPSPSASVEPAGEPAEPAPAEATAALAAAEPAPPEAVAPGPAAAVPVGAETPAGPTDTEAAGSGVAPPTQPEPVAAAAAPADATEIADVGALEPLAFEQAAPAAGETDASLAARIVNIPNGASFERNMLEGAEDMP